MATTYNIKITCETDESEIHYEASGSADSVPADVTKSSSLYSSEFGLSVSSAGAQISAKGFKNGMEDSDAITKIIKPVTVPMILPDGSVLFYDRGSNYGNYLIGNDGYPVRCDGAVDDGTASSDNWRYLICDSANLSEIKAWGPYNTDEGMTDAKYADLGYGLHNTEALLSKYGDNSSYIWQLVQNKRNATGEKKWFVPSKDELNIVYQNKDAIVSAGGGSFPTDYFYWSSSEESSRNAWYQSFSDGLQNLNRDKSYTYYCRLLRRI